MEPGNRAHAFQMTVVAQGKLPQIILRALHIDTDLPLHVVHSEVPAEKGVEKEDKGA